MKSDLWYKILRVLFLIGAVAMFISMILYGTLQDKLFLEIGLGSAIYLLCVAGGIMIVCIKEDNK